MANIELPCGECVKLVEVDTSEVTLVVDASAQPTQPDWYRFNCPEHNMTVVNSPQTKVAVEALRVSGVKIQEIDFTLPDDVFESRQRIQSMLGNFTLDELTNIELAWQELPTRHNTDRNTNPRPA